MYAHELFEAGKPNIVVTYPGRFQPFHQGHAGVFAQLQKKFGRDSVFILTSNDQSSAKSPFNFSDKYQLISAAGVPGARIVETNKMYVLPEGFDPANTIFITAVGAPDATRLSPDSFLKRDRKDAEGNVIKPAGSPSYYKTWGGAEEPMTADQHGYVIVIPEIKKNVTLNGQTYDVSHGTECRNLWNQVRNDEKARDEFLKALYGKSTPELVHIFNKIPDAANEDIALDTVAEDASGYIPKNKKEANDPRWSNALTVDVHTDTPKKNLKAFRLAEFAPSDNGGGRKFIPWPEFIDAVKQIVGKDFAVTEKIIKNNIQDRFIPHDPMEYGPTLLYSYYEARLGRNKGAVSTRGSIQVGKYYPNTTALGKQNFITQFSLLKGHPFERHFDLTFDNIYKIANIILGNTEGAYQMPQQQGVAENLDEDFGDFDRAVKQLKESKESPDLPELLAKFLPIAMKELKISKLPKIKLEKHIETHDGQASFGRFVNDENVIHLPLADRHPLDTLRTLAHELVHYKQFTEHELNHDSGTTGSPEENEAHAIAGIIMRHFNKAYPELIKLNPINMD